MWYSKKKNQQKKEIVILARFRRLACFKTCRISCN